MTFSCMHVHSKADFGQQLDSQCHDFFFEGHPCWEVELHIVLKISFFLGNCFLVLCLKSCDFSAGYKYMQYFVKKKKRLFIGGRLEFLGLSSRFISACARIGQDGMVIGHRSFMST